LAGRGPTERAAGPRRTNVRPAILFLPRGIVAAILLGRMMPITPLQILWVSLVSSVTLALSLAFEPPERAVMARPPRNPSEPVLSGFLVWQIPSAALMFVAGVFGLFLWNRTHGVSVEVARTLAVNTLVMCEVLYLLSARYAQATALSRDGIFGNGYATGAMGLVVVLQLLFTYAKPMRQVFETTPIPGLR